MVLAGNKTKRLSSVNHTTKTILHHHSPKKFSQQQFILTVLKLSRNICENWKNELKSDSIIFLGDFAENYGFVIQDEVQSFHWRNLPATIHPVVIYYKEN